MCCMRKRSNPANRTGRLLVVRVVLLISQPWLCFLSSNTEVAILTLPWLGKSDLIKTQTLENDTTQNRSQHFLFKETQNCLWNFQSYLSAFSKNPSIARALLNGAFSVSFLAPQSGLQSQLYLGYLFYSEHLSGGNSSDIAEVWDNTMKTSSRSGK